MTARRRTDRSTPSDALALLEVIDRLEVGPAVIEKQRLVAPYTVHQNGESTTHELAYRWEEAVFDPDSEADRNLAAMIAAQVAINYGLFCRELVFHGPLDEVDRQLLESMIELTARETYISKLVEPNPYLVGPVRELPFVKRRSYSRARLVFPDAVPGQLKQDLAEEPDERRIAVLASGGKESLLTQGLLEELGREVHAVFVNESGRHWHTALNAYRALSRDRPATTARVWTSSDRVFSAMLRHLPFVREDFASVRHDEYPIRTWTVAVFLFGALPLLRKRGIGNLVIGDEYDTTQRSRYRGLEYHHNLYDQSRHFDVALSRYYRRKSWPLAQFSLLRPLSELLIEKVLVERYPDLQRLQTSCHSTHVDEDRVLPCGRCEKCRRVVGMLVALGADPKRCGYSESQIADCLAALAERGVHQEAPGAQQLAFMLARAGRLPESSPGFGSARERPEVLALRFDRQASPIDATPLELRAPLWSMLLEHANGALTRRGRGWVEFDPLGDPSAAAPFRFDPRPGKHRRTKAGGAGEAAAPPPEQSAEADAVARREYLLAEMTWPYAAERFRETDTALLPVGAIEQHGYHLPLDTDSWDAEQISIEVAARCSAPRPIVLPLIPYGVSYHHDDFPGTISVSPETLSALVIEVGIAIARHGITKLVIVNGHGGNVATLQLAAQRINQDTGIFTCVESGETSAADVSQILETPNDVHAGEEETSTTLATRPHLVDLDRLESAVPRFEMEYLDFTSKRGVPWYAYTDKLSSSGVLGDATKASKEKGEKIWRLFIDHLVRFVENIKQMSLDEIHRGLS